MSSAPFAKPPKLEIVPADAGVNKWLAEQADAAFCAVARLEMQDPTLLNNPFYQSLRRAAHEAMFKALDKWAG